MIYKVCYLVNGFSLVVCLACDYNLGAFLSNLFENLINSLFKEICGVRAFLFLYLSSLDYFHKSIKGELLVLALVNYLVEAGIRSRVARRSVLIYGNGKSIAVAVGHDRNDVLLVSRRLSLSPKALSGSRPKARRALVHAYFKAFLVHISNGQNLFRYRINNNCRDKTVFIKFKLFNRNHFLPQL